MLVQVSALFGQRHDDLLNCKCKRWACCKSMPSLKRNTIDVEETSMSLRNTQPLQTIKWGRIKINQPFQLILHLLKLFFSYSLCTGKGSVCKDTIRGNFNGNNNSGNSKDNGNKNGNCIGKCVNVITGNLNGNNNTEGSNGRFIFSACTCDMSIISVIGYYPFDILCPGIGENCPSVVVYMYYWKCRCV